jgi:aryl-alcohol dehydrogenase-like predicted oxidoreductase
LLLLLLLQIVDETLPALLELKQQGVIRAIGITGYHWTSSVTSWTSELPLLPLALVVSPVAEAVSLAQS